MKFPNDIDAIFESSAVRRSRLGAQWLYAAEDIVRAVADRRDAEEYWQDLKRWEPHLAAMCRKVRVHRDDGVWQELEMVSAEQALRLIQSIDSAKAEKIKLFLAEAGRERMEESANPELALQRSRNLFENRGYSRDWISKRIRGISARHELTGQWYKRGATESQDYRTLTNDLLSAAFGMDVESYKRYKNLRSENLRDHMSDLELALVTLGETTAAILHKDRGSMGLEELERDVKDAGEIAGTARSEIERRLGKPVVTPENYVQPPFGKKKRVSVESADK